MTDSAPRKRFRFSLQFLIAWVLLSGATLGLTFSVQEAFRSSVAISKSFKRSLKPEERTLVIRSGFPFYNYSETHTFDSSETISLRGTVQYFPLGVLANVLSWSAFSLVVLGALAWLRTKNQSERKP